MVQVRSSRDDVLTSVVEEKGAIDHTVPTQKVSASVPKIPMEIGTPSIQAPPGLLFRPGSQPTPSQQDMRHCGIDDDSFAMMLRSAPLPAGLCADLVKLGHLKDAIYLAVESMYFDRIVPALGELRGRLRGCGWQPSDFSCLLQICAHSPKTYELVPPTGEHPPQVLLRSTPPWFKGWCEDDEIHDPFSETVWQEFKTVLAGAAKEPKGGVVRMAEALRKMQLPTHMQCLSLGELRHLIVLALSPQKGLLTYDPLNGGRFLTHAGNHQTCHDKPAEDADSKNGVQVVQAQKDEAPPTALNGVKRAFHNADRDKNGVAKESVKATKPLESQVDVSHDGARCNECMPPLAHVGESVSHNGLACGGDGNRSSALMAASIDDGGSVVQDVGELLGAFNLQTLAMEYYLHVAALQHCIQSFYFQRVDPTLGLVQERLLHYGWSPTECQLAAQLCAKHPELFQLIAPARGEPLRVHLRTAPSPCGHFGVGPATPTVEHACGRADGVSGSQAVGGAGHDACLPLAEPARGKKIYSQI
mmetsp:Transcript_95533/g.274065  ORF Transcript_95533/g.274065 Transcript_95533/m.274065 type:complete len:530 (-) Transcript_95533:95-1684(-)